MALLGSMAFGCAVTAFAFLTTNDTLMKLVDTLEAYIGLIAACLGLMMSLAAYFAVHFEMDPLARLEQVMTKIQDDDVAAEVPAQNRDEDERRFMMKKVADDFEREVKMVTHSASEAEETASQELDTTSRLAEGADTLHGSADTAIAHRRNG